MTAEAIRWLLGLNLVAGVWLGMLANSWKGRSLYRWALIGFIFNLGGLVILTVVPKLKQNAVQPKVLEA